MRLFLTLLTWTMASMVMARPMLPESTLAARLNLEGESKCWDSLFKLQSCAGEVILFFLNGEIYLGHECCCAIQIIEHECWPAMLTSLGFTAQEGSILRGYCDATEEVTTTTTTTTENPSP
ncbi:Prolamin-like domain [Dillenia turbinata]|uniref:Prolamin-like domain n=1 Tax=Dillenia turbinata TaxID=194707 RepID=A0AAN8UTD4_9MAGN